MRYASTVAYRMECPQMRTERLNTLAVDMLSIFAFFFRLHRTQIRFEKRRNSNNRLAGIAFLEPANWPDESFEDMNTAFLSLHHAGYIVYGANTIKLKDKLKNAPSGAEVGNDVS
jgi:hypothetical protein